jgi:tetratricopeptide (TPR) repeat protein
MVHRRLWTLCLTSLILQTGLVENAPAAKKYYPPGYTQPEQKPATETPPQVQVPPVVIIKTIPVKPVQKDPLLVLIDEHRYFEALRLVDNRLKKSPNNISLQLTRGDILREDGHYDRAVTQFQSIYDHNRVKSTRALALNGLGWTHYRKALREEQSGNTEGFKHRIQLSENAFKQSTQLAPYLSDAWAGLGRAALLDKRLQDAEPPIRKSLRLAPNGLQSQLAFSELLLAKNKPEDALQMLYGLKRTTTHEPDVFFLLARASLATNRVDDAVINLKQLLEIVPEHTAGLKLLSTSYERKMMPEDAEQTLQKAIALNPVDEKSVETLLKIYEQRGEQERGLLLLTTLIKEAPQEAGYAARLLSYLQRQQRWKRSYEEGLILVPALLNNPKVSEEAKRELAHYFALAVNWQNKTLLNNQAVLSEPAVQTLQTYLIQRLEQETQKGSLGLIERRDLLLVNPLVDHLPEAPLTTDNLKESLSAALQVAYLSGDQGLYTTILKLTTSEDSSKKFLIAKELTQLGDYTGALTLVNSILSDKSVSPDEGVVQLKQELLALQEQKQQHLTSLAMLPKKIPAGYFEKTATEALRLGTGDWQIHAALAKAFEKRHAYELAHKQQLLAAHFAPTEKERSYWRRQAEKTQSRIKS